MAKKKAKKAKKPESELDQLKKANKALQDVLESHNIKFDVDKADLGNIRVNKNGKARGKVDYSPPGLPSPKLKALNKSKSKLDVSDVKSMTREQIAANMDEVEKAMGVFVEQKEKKK